MISFKVRFSNGQTSPVADVLSSHSILEVKSLLLERNLSDVEPEKQRLIFKGRILTDVQTLEGAGVVEGSTVHFVKSTTKAAPTPPPAAPPVAAAPANLAGMFGQAAPGSGGGNAMMDMIRNSPQMQRMMEQNPEMAQALNSPEAMQQMVRFFELFRGFCNSRSY
jgi:ubiquilin